MFVKKIVIYTNSTVIIILFVLVEAGGHSADWQEIIVFDILFVFLYLQQGIFITHLLIYYIRIYIVKLLLVFMFSNILYRILLYLSYVLNLQQSYFRMHFVVLLSLWLLNFFVVTIFIIIHLILFDLTLYWDLKLNVTSWLNLVHI